MEFDDLISRQATLYGYNIEHLELIARVLQKEDLPPERVAEVLADIGRIVAIVKDEIEEVLRKEVEAAWNKRVDKHVDGVEVFCDLMTCKHNNDGLCKAESIYLMDDHSCAGGCDYGWDIDEKEEEKQE